MPYIFEGSQVLFLGYCPKPTPVQSVRFAKEVFTDDLRSLFEQATIECDDAFIIIKRYDCEQAFHFIDPPYVGGNMGLRHV